MALTLDQALDRLLHHRGYRAAFLDGRHEALDLAPADLEALDTINRTQLVATAAKVKDELLRRRHRGSGGLRELFARTLGDADLDALLDRFMESAAFERYRELPHAGEGASLEEAFFRFCEAEGVGEPAAREEDFLLAMAKALAVSPRPGFTVPPELRRAPGGWFAVSRAHTLFAAVGGRLVTGPLTPFLAALLVSEEPAEAVGRRFGVGPEVVRAAVEKLEGMGLR